MLEHKLEISFTCSGSSAGLVGLNFISSWHALRSRFDVRRNECVFGRRRSLYKEWQETKTGSRSVAAPHTVKLLGKGAGDMLHPIRAFIL